MAARSLPPKDYIRQCFSYDRNTGELRWKVRPREHFKTERAWRTMNTRFAGTIAGYIHSDGRIYIGIDSHVVFAHRVIWKGMTGDEPEAEIDHINHNPSDNRWSNLRVATHAQNMANMKRYNKTGMKGVYKVNGRFAARVADYYIGCFATAEDAHVAYCQAAQKLFGEFWCDGKRAQL